MITDVRKGDLFESGAQTLVNTVNTVGVMGKGIALEFRKRFPSMFADYVERCRHGLVKLGEPYIYQALVPPSIVNFPTKEHWRAVSRLDAIVDGLKFLADHIEEWGVTSLAVPPLGCGNGQLEWSVVGPTLYRHLHALPIPVMLYAPHDATDEEMTSEFLKGATNPSGEAQRLPVALAAVADIVRRLSEERYSWPVGHTRFQKLCYFAAAAGVALPVEFEERPYGPFAPGLKRELARLVNNGVLRERKESTYVLVEPGPTLEDALRRHKFALSEYEDAIAKVTDLMLRLDPKRTELAATVHFVVRSRFGTRNVTPNDTDVLNEVKRWKKDKFSDFEIASALGALANLGWLRLDSTSTIDAVMESDAAAVA